jgi:hypothetical protein
MANSQNVLVGKPAAGDGIAAAPVGTALPTTVATALDVAFKKLGYVSDDGLTEGENRSTDSITAWGGATVASTQTSFEKTVQFTLIEFLNENAQKVFRGDANVTVTAANGTHGTQLAVHETADLPPLRSWVIDIVAGGARVRHVIPSGRITDSDDISWTDGDPAGLNVTVSAFPDESGVYVYTYTDDGILDAG